MRVLVLIDSLFPGGAEFSTLTLYGWMTSQGVEVKIVCLKETRIAYDPKNFGLGPVNILQAGGFRPRLRALNKIIDKFKPDILHSVLFKSNILGRFCRFRQRGMIHLESLVNETYSPFRLNDPNVTILKLWGYQLLDWSTQLWGVDHFHANGYSVARHYQSKLRISPKRITVVPRGRMANAYLEDAASRANVRSEFGVSDQTVLLVTVGRHEFQKGHDILLKAIAGLGFHTSLKCLIVGREGAQTGMIRSQIEHHELTNTVVLTGHRTDVAQILAASDIFIFPSRFEGLPGALIEAEAAGLPIICSDIDNNREVANGSNALFFSVDDVKELRAHITYLLNNPRKREEMQINSLAIFKDRFQIESIHHRMKELLEELLEKKRAAGKSDNLLR